MNKSIWPNRLRSTFTMGVVLAALFTLMAAGTSFAATSDALAHRMGIERDGWVVSASTSEAQATNAIDGIEDSSWRASLGNGDYFEVDLGQTHTVNRLEWLTGNGRDEFPTAFRIEVSLDGKAWNTVADSSSAQYVAEEGLLQVIWEPTEAKFLRVVQASENVEVVRLGELLIWEEGMEVGAVIQYFDFFPRNLLVAEGTTVNWLQLDGAPHTVTAGEPFGSPALCAFDSSGEANGTMEFMVPGDTFAHAFKEVGEFLYHCIPHIGMQAYVIVTQP